MSEDQYSIWDDGYPDEQAEKDIDLHVAKMIEHMEWEMTLPDAEKNKRRLIRFINTLDQSAKVAAKFNMPWVMFGCLERIVYYAEQVLGPDWREKARQERSQFVRQMEDDDE